MSHSVLRFFQLLSCYTLTSSEVRWVLKTAPVIFGGDVTLSCLLPDKFEASSARQWKIGSKRIILDESSIDSNKYEGSLEQDGFTLKIKNFRVEDFDREYTCSYDFVNYSANFTKQNYQWYPQPDTYEVDVLNSTVESIKVEVRFQKVYPEPNCSSRIGHKPIPAEFNKSSHVVDRYFRATNLALEYHYDDFDCGEEVFILCKLGNTSATILTENITTPRQCEDICQKFSPCLNNGTCKSNKSSIGCDCTDGFSGERCENSNSTTTQVFNTTVADIVTESDTWVTPFIVTVFMLCALPGLIFLAYKGKKCLSTGKKSKKESEIRQDENKELTDKNSNGVLENEQSVMVLNGSQSM